MMKFLMKKVATAAMATGALLAMSAGSALAGPTFTINPSAIPTPFFAFTPFTAGFISGSSSELLRQNPTNTGYFGSGYVQFGSFTGSSGVISSLDSGLNSDYGLYLKFDIAVTYTGGGTGNGSLGSNYNVTQLDFTVFADPGSPTIGRPNDTYTQANATTGTPATVFSPTSDDLLLAFGGLVPGATSVAVINSAGGVGVNTVESFAICSAPGFAKLGGTTIAAPGCGSNIGTNYFQAPNPFYSIAFTEFNNVGPTGITRTGNPANPTTIGIADASGGVTFAAVPEPGSMALLGIALAGLGLSRRNKNKAAKAA